MKNLFTFLLILFSIAAQSQTLTIKSVSTGANSGGFYEYLPAGYDGAKKFPLIVFLHGLGELGSGQPGDINKILNNGIPMYLNTNQAFRDTLKFIVIAPQFRAWPNANDVEAVLAYVKANYAVDYSRVYMTGLSMGGGATWSYMGYNEDRTSKIAAILPVCGAYAPDSYGMTTIAKLGVGVWATHNSGDPTVTVNNTNGWVDGINARNPVVIAKKTIWNSTSHNAWGQTYDPSSNEFGGGNVYKWFLQYSRPLIPTPGPTPFAPYYLTTGAAFGSWKMDAPFVKQTIGWGSNTMGFMAPIAGTTDQALYNVERFGDMKYSFPVPNGTYTVKLHFAELFFVRNGAGKRVFHVNAEGVRALSDFDIVAQSGSHYRAIQRSFDVKVADGTLNLDFVSVVDNAKVTAIEITEAGSAVVIPYQRVILTEFRDSASNNLLKSYTDTFRVPVKVTSK